MQRRKSKKSDNFFQKNKVTKDPIENLTFDPGCDREPLEFIE